MKLAFGARWLACLCLPVLAVACGGDDGVSFSDGGAGGSGAGGSGGSSAGTGGNAASGGSAGSATVGGNGGSGNGGSSSGGTAGNGGSSSGGAANGGSSSGGTAGNAGNSGGGAGGAAAGGSGGNTSGGAAGSAAGGAGGAAGSGAAGGAGGSGGATGSTEDLLISEYLEGSTNNKALEIFNGGAASVDLSDCSLLFYFAGSGNSAEIKLTGSLASKATFVVCDVDAVAAITDKCDLKSDAFFFNGDDAIELVCKNALIDSFGQRGVDPGEAWGDPNAATFTKDHTLRRKCSVTRGDTLSTDAFDPAVQWEGFPINTSMGLGRHCTG